MTVAQISISIPKCEKGIGDVILAPDSPKLIAGVKCAPITLWPDDRGYFLEVQRFGEGLVEGSPKRPRRFRRRSITPESSRRFTSTATRRIAGRPR